MKHLRLVLAAALLVVPLGSHAWGGHDCRDHYPAGTRCADASISIRYRAEPNRFVGDVDSHMDYCVRRVVAVRKVRAGTDRTVATTRTDDEGRWRLDVGSHTHGRFYAVARFKERYYGIDSHDICYRARSRTIRV